MIPTVGFNMRKVTKGNVTIKVGHSCLSALISFVWFRNRCYKSTPFFWRWFLVCVSCKSGTGFIWYQIPALMQTLFYSKPESGMLSRYYWTVDNANQPRFTGRSYHL